MSFPSQTLSEDPAAPARSQFYDRAFSSWLPVSRKEVSNDGTRYAYAEGNAYLQNSEGRLHVVDVASRTDRVIYRGATVYAVVDFAPEGIYLTLAAPEGPSRGLWLQDPVGGAARLISSTIEAPEIYGGAAWGQEFDTSDASPAPGGIIGPRNRIVRLDLHTGTLATWFYRPGANVRVVGFDARGNPFVNVDRSPPPNDPNGRDSEELWLVTSPAIAAQVFVGSTSQPWPYTVAAVDTHGVWFDGGSYLPSGGTVWLYVGNAIHMVVAVNADSLAVAGGCLISG